MEKAIFVDLLAQASDAAIYQNLYIGDEFCERRLPSEEELMLALCKGNELGCSVTLVTPYVTDVGIARIALLVKAIKQQKTSCEIVINDWGVLEFLKSQGEFSVVLGRLLVSRYLTSEVLKNGNGYVEFPESFMRFICEQHIKTLEFNVYQQVKSTCRQRKQYGIGAHLYFPCSYITTSRFCSCARGFHDYLRQPDDGCKRECLRLEARLESNGSDRRIVIKGNTYLYFSDDDFATLADNVDRVILNDLSYVEKLAKR